MTTLAEAPVAAPAAAEVETAAPGEKPARLTREAAIAAVEAALAAFADQMIFARQLTLGTHNVVDGSLCESGTKEFMARARLQPLQRRGYHPRDERPEETREYEAAIRTWVRTSLEGALEDYTATGLMKQVPKIEAAHKKWHEAFRNDIISNFKGGYIKQPRMAEVLPLLGMEPYEPRMYANIQLNVDWHAPASALGGAGLTFQQMNEALRTKIIAAVKEIAGEHAQVSGCNYGLEGTRHIRVSTDTWRN